MGAFAPAQAQAPAEPVAAQREPGDETVVVTAQRRTQRLQDVPIAIRSFSGREIRELGADKLQDLVRVVPNVTLYDDRGSGQPTWVIRGIGLADFNPNNTPTAALFYDEIYTPSNALSGLGLFDLERVEVLKGPQGGLYGRNTSGGAIRVISARPVLGETGGYVDASFGSFEAIKAQGAVNIPLGDIAALRLSARLDRGGGWQDSLATPQDDTFGDQDFFALRGQLLLQPNEDLSFLLKVEGGTDRSQSLLGRATGTENMALARGFCPAVLSGVRNDQTCGTWADRNLLASRRPLGFSARDQSDDGSVVLSNPINQFDNQWAGATLNAAYDFGGITLTSITGYLQYDYRQVFDYDGSQLELGHENSDVGFEVWSQELRLQSDDSGAFDWMVGAIYNSDTIEDTRVFSLRDNVIAAPPPVNALRRSYVQETKSWALYVNLGYDVTDQVRVHGSLRYTDETKTISQAELFIPALNFYLFRNQSRELALADNWTGDIGIDYKPSEDLLVYAKATKGYKSGGFFGGVATDPSGLNPYREESIWSYEAGVKAELDGGLRINGAVFFYDYSDRQGYLNQRNPLTGFTAVTLGNVGDVELYGAELEITWSPPQVAGLTLMFNPAYVAGEIVDSTATSVTITGVTYGLEGLPVSTPRWSYFAMARYERAISGDLLASIQLNYAWRQSPNPNTDYTARNLVTYALYHIPDYGSLDARLALGNEVQGWEVSLEAKNLTDANDFTVATRDSGGSYMTFYNPPRRFNLSVNYSF
jgi:iron complex outermembrane receptor protein